MRFCRTSSKSMDSFSDYCMHAGGVFWPILMHLEFTKNIITRKLTRNFVVCRRSRALFTSCLLCENYLSRIPLVLQINLTTMAMVTKQQKFVSAKGLLHLATIAMPQSDLYLNNGYLATVAKQPHCCYASGYLSLWQH